MSIYATVVNVDSDDHADRCARWVPCTEQEALNAGRGAFGDREWWRYDAEKPCTCAAGPIQYQGSHILPSDDDPRDGSVSLCMIPGFIERDGRALADAGADDRPCWPWLRLSMNTEQVVLTRAHVQEIHDYLGQWLRNAGEAS